MTALEARAQSKNMISEGRKGRGPAFLLKGRKMGLRPAAEKILQEMGLGIVHELDHTLLLEPEIPSKIQQFSGPSDPLSGSPDELQYVPSLAMRTPTRATPRPTGTRESSMSSSWAIDEGTAIFSALGEVSVGETIVARI